MLFNVEVDRGSELVGYVVLDDFSAVPSIVVRGRGLEVRVEANEIREPLVTSGRHETGRCGFRLNNAIFPGIVTPDLELREATSGVLIYRRRQAGDAIKKILRVETHLLPLWRFDRAVAPRFQYAMTRVEAYGLETVTQMFLLPTARSQYLSGRLLYKNYERFIDAGFDMWTCVHHPYDELAERLLVLKGVRNLGQDVLSERDKYALAPVIGYIEDVSFHEARDVKRALRAIPGAAAMRLSNPLTRQLTTTEPDEMPGGGAVAASLDMLARCELVGLREESDAFATSAGQLVDLSAEDAPPLSQPMPAVRRLSQMIADCGAAETLLEKDLELFYYLNKAAAAAARPSEDA